MIYKMHDGVTVETCHLSNGRVEFITRNASAEVISSVTEDRERASRRIMELATISTWGSVLDGLGLVH